jgi:hypothetical protein
VPRREDKAREYCAQRTQEKESSVKGKAIQIQVVHDQVDGSNRLYVLTDKGRIYLEAPNWKGDWRWMEIPLPTDKELKEAD